MIGTAATMAVAVGSGCGCECVACLMPAADRNPVQAFVAHVHINGCQARAGFWTAYAQGYLAALEGRPTVDLTPYRCHAVDHDFRRGHADALAGKAYS
jgi:hypothetical protein